MLSNPDREAVRKAFEPVMAKFAAPLKDWPEFVNLAYDTHPSAAELLDYPVM